MKNKNRRMFAMNFLCLCFVNAIFIGLFAMIGGCGGGGSGGGSAADTSTPSSPSGDTTTPSSPRDLTASTSSQGHINLSWTASTDNVGVTGYEVYRDGTFLKSVTSTSTSDTGLSTTSQYCYTVLAYDAAGNKSTQSAQACATTDSADNDGDLVPNAFDAFPLDPSESKDDDGDGIGNFADRDETIYFFVTEEVNNALYAELSQFMDDVADDTATTTVLEISPENPTDLLAEIKNAYQNDNLEGVFFIGDVPFFTINIIDWGSFISDHPFRALSCPYIADANDPTVLYREGIVSLTSNFHYLHIWTSRIKATKLGQDGIEQIRAYLEKNHRMRYAFDNWQEAMHYSTATPRDPPIGWPQESIQNFFANHPLYRADQVSVDQSLDAFTQRNNWIGAIENNIEIAKIDIHGSPTYIQFQGEDTNDNIDFSASDLLGISIRSKILEFDSCSVGNFSVQNYLAGDLLFNGDTLMVRAFTSPTFMVLYEDFRLDNDGFYRAYAYGASPSDVYCFLIPGEPIHFFGDPTVPLRKVDLSHPRPRLFLNGEHFTESFDYPIDMGDVEDTNTSRVIFELANTGTDVLEVRGNMFSGSTICANGEHVASQSDFIFEISGVIKSGFSYKILVLPGEVGRFTMNFTPGYNNDKTLPSGAVYDALFSLSTNDPLSPAFLLRPFGRHIKK